MRDPLAHRYFDTNHGHVSGAVHHDLEPLKAAVLRLSTAYPRSASGISTPTRLTGLAVGAGDDVAADA